MKGCKFINRPFTDALKSNYDPAYTHSQAAHAPSNAQANVATNLGITGTTAARVITSSTGDNVTIPVATASVSGVMSKATFDAVALNTAKATDVNHNVTTNLGVTTSTTTIDVTSSDGTDATLPVATTSAGGIMSKALFDNLTAATTHVAAAHAPTNATQSWNYV